MKILALVSDAFGGRGGIAKFNRDLLAALCLMPEIQRVVALPRVIGEPPDQLPDKLDYITCAADGKLRYGLAVLHSAIRNPHSALILCGHIHLLPFAFLARALCRGSSSRCPVVLIVHGIEAWQPTRRRLVNRLARRIDALIAVTDFTRRHFLAWAKPERAQTFLLPNCVDLSRFTPGPKNPALLERYGLRDRAVLLTVARLSTSERYKGIDEVLTVLPSLARDIPSLAYLIVGHGDDRARLQARARQLGVADRVVFTGWVNDTELVEHYRLGDAFVMPGRGEGFGIVYLEALACGVPVVASRADASAEVVNGCERATVADPSNPADVEAAIRAALQFGRGSPPKMLERYSTAQFQERCSGIFQPIAHREGVAPVAKERAMATTPIGVNGNRAP